MLDYVPASTANEYCIYLRKSRVDIEAEAHGEGETLARHEKLLLEVARRDKLNVTEIYREVVSGETIAARPVMQHLLEEVAAGRWEGVLVVEVERLARGDTVDQGVMAQTFQYSGTKIITPLKTYDPTNEFDEEYFEFGLFMSRREYKTINRRLQRGRLASAKEGKWVSGIAPYGYERVRVPNDKGWTLRPVEDEADIVRFIFRLYTSGEAGEDGSVKKFGSYSLALRLDSMGVAPPGSSPCWNSKTIQAILQTPSTSAKSAGMSARRKGALLTTPSASSDISLPLTSRFSLTGCTPPSWTRTCSSLPKTSWPTKARPLFNPRTLSPILWPVSSSAANADAVSSSAPMPAVASSCARTASAITSAPSSALWRSACCRPSRNGSPAIVSSGLTICPPKNRP